MFEVFIMVAPSYAALKGYHYVVVFRKFGSLSIEVMSDE